MNVVNWYLELPLFGQIIVILIILLIVVGTYYLLKGIGYLIYYAFKGIYYLIRGFFLGIYKIIKGLYNLISGKHKKSEQEETIQHKEPIESKETPQKLIQEYQPAAEYYCSECGMKFSDKMAYKIYSKGITFCDYCGKGFEFVNNGLLSVNPIPSSTPHNK